MRFLPLLLLLTLGACSWSNSLYHARRLSDSALKAEREERNFDASSLWGQAAVKADSAQARSDPESDDAIEARWLRGRAMAHLGNCTEAVPLLDEARILAGDVPWSDDLALELARCRGNAGDTDAAMELITGLLASDDNNLRQQARSLGGRILLRAERWSEAELLLADDDTRTGRWLYAVALARTGRSAEALETVEPFIEAGDRTQEWGQLVGALASRNDADATALLEQIGAMPMVTDSLRSAWLLAAAEGSSDPVRRRAWLDTLVKLPRTPAVSRGRALLIQQGFASATDPTQLQATITELASLSREDPVALLTLNRLSRWGSAMLADIDSIAPGEVEGDMAMFYHAMVAHDSLGSPRLASWFLRTLERDWPDSPYVPKALLWRITIEPDSAAAIRQRLTLDHTYSPYLVWMRGGDDPRFAELEYALDFYLGDRFAAGSSEVIQ